MDAEAKRKALFRAKLNAQKKDKRIDSPLLSLHKQSIAMIVIDVYFSLIIVCLARDMYWPGKLLSILLLTLRIVGILLPIFVMVRALTSIQRLRHYQVSNAVYILICFEYLLAFVVIWEILLGGFVECKIVECKICHDEDDESNMETPCSCCGSLKYAHRKCVQRWCNEKGNTICEICHQDFKPGYTAPPPVFCYEGINSPMNFSWEMSRMNLHVPVGMPDHEYPDSDFDDFLAPSSRSVLYCRIIAVIFIVLLVLRHTLPIIVSEAGEYSLTLLMLLTLRIVGILLPIFVMVRAFTSIQRQRHYQDPHLQLTMSDDESDSRNHSPSRSIHSRWQ